MRRFLNSFLIVVFCTFSFLPTTLAQPWLKGAKIYTGDGVVIGNIVVDGSGKILGVGADVIGQGTSIDAKGKVITPGFIDAATGLGLVEIWAVQPSNDRSAGSLDREKDYIQAAFRAVDGFNPNAIAIPITRTGGVTSSVIVPNGHLISGQSAWVDLSATGSWYATTVAQSVALNIQMGSRSRRVANGSRAGAMLLLREAFEDAQFFKKNNRVFDEKRTDQTAVSRLDLIALSNAVDGNPVVFSVNRANDILATLQFAETYNLKPIISGGAEAWMVAKQLAKNKTPVIIDPMANLPFNFDELGSRADNAALLDDAGVPVILSTFESHNVRNLRFQAGNAVRAGLSYEAAIASITKNVAEAFGMDDYGVLKKGKIANFVVWSGDPFEPSSRVERMFIKGKEVSLDNRQQKLFERYRKLDRRGKPAEQQAGKKDDDEKLNEKDP